MMASCRDPRLEVIKESPKKQTVKLQKGRTGPIHHCGEVDLPVSKTSKHHRSDLPKQGLPRRSKTTATPRISRACLPRFQHFNHQLQTAAFRVRHELCNCAVTSGFPPSGQLQGASVKTGLGHGKRWPELSEGDDP